MAISPIIADGITFASALALLAFGITLLYVCTRTFNFAHASMATWGLYVAYTGVSLFGGTPYHYLPFAFLLGALLGAICYFGINGPLLRRKASDITLMMSTLGYDLVLLSFIQIYCDYLTHVYKLHPRLITLSVYDFIVFGVKASMLISLIITIGILLFLHVFLYKTRFGVAIRATIENPALSSIIGINSERVYLVSWIIGGGLACLGGALIAMVSTGTPVMGMLLVVSMFAASILGGLYSIYGGAIGGYVVGLAEYIGIYVLKGYVGTWVLSYRPVLPLIIMSTALLLFPQGLAGISWESIIKRFKGAKKSEEEVKSE
ncbi:MAG: branched-chain amino acid ABC transporter permease [Thermoprotei archaeon]|nr:MAG: branched-chain amino acid ABC transporter permease [Thermoprotei archaeon]